MPVAPPTRRETLPRPHAPAGSSLWPVSVPRGLARLQPADCGPHALCLERAFGGAAHGSPRGDPPWAASPQPWRLCLLHFPRARRSPICQVPQGLGGDLLGWEMCTVCSFWWALHSFLVKSCAWKTRIYGQHPSYEQSNCTLCRDYLARTAGVAMVTLPPPPPMRLRLLPTWDPAAGCPPGMWLCWHRRRALPPAVPGSQQSLRCFPRDTAPGPGPR